MARRALRGMSRRRRSIIAGTVAGAVAMSGVAVSVLSNGSAALSQANGGSPRWRPCKGLMTPPGSANESQSGSSAGMTRSPGPGAPTGPQNIQSIRLECATLKVPVDYAHPEGGQLDVAISRLSAPGSKPREPLLINPGGPGGSGLVMPLVVMALGGQKLLARYDLIGFDPRGLGRSTRVSCGLTAEQKSALPPWPTGGSISANISTARQIAEQCQRTSPRLMPHITTSNTARDMDRIRIALGQKRIAYLGYSYGTYLGAVYDALFPAHLDRAVLDSVVSPKRIWRGSVLAWGPAVEKRFPDFTSWLASKHSTYGLGTTSKQVRGRYFTLITQLTRSPLRVPTRATPTGRIDGHYFAEFTLTQIDMDQSFPFLAQFWRDVYLRDETAATEMIERVKNTAIPQPAAGGIDTMLGVFCNDAPWPRSPKVYEDGVRQDEAAYPLAGGMAANIWPCAFWPRKWVQHPVPIRQTGQAKILLVENERDPATPYRGAVDMRAALGDRAHLVTVEGGGHIGFLIRNSPCLRKTVFAFLVQRLTLTRNLRCAARPATDGKGV